MEFTFASPQKQLFSMPYNFIDYIIKNPRSPIAHQKLYKTCKYFYSKNQILIFPTSCNLKKTGACLQVNYSQHLELKNEKLWFNDDLAIFDYTIASKELQNIYRCSIKSLGIVNSVLSMTEFDLLVAENRIVDLHINASCILDSEDNNVPIHEILRKVPNARTIWYNNEREKYSAESLANLNNVKFNNKLKFCCFWLRSVTTSFDPILLCKFIEQNAQHNSEFDFMVRGYNSGEVARALKASAKILTWKGKTFVIRVTAQ